MLATAGCRWQPPAAAGYQQAVAAPPSVGRLEGLTVVIGAGNQVSIQPSSNARDGLKAGAPAGSYAHTPAKLMTLRLKLK